MPDYRLRILIEGVDQASGAINSVKGALGDIGKIAAGVSIANVLGSVTRGLVDMAGGALESYASYERLGMSINSLSAKEALLTGQAGTMQEALAQTSGKSKELLNWIQKLAIESPFKQEDVAGAFRLSMALGFSTSEAQRLTSAMLNFSTATGSGGETIERIARALGQMRTKGKVSLEEINQLTESGVDAMRILADATGMTGQELTNAISKGAVDANTAIDAILADTERLYAGAGKNSAESMSGLLSTLEEIRDISSRNLLSGVFQAAQPYIAGIASILTAPEFQQGLQNWGAALGGFTVTALESAVTTVDHIASTVQPLLDAQAPAWLTALGGLAGLNGGAVEITPVLPQGYSGLDVPAVGTITAVNFDPAKDYGVTVAAVGNVTTTTVDLQNSKTGKGGKLVIDSVAGVTDFEWLAEGVGFTYDPANGFRMAVDVQATEKELGIGDLDLFGADAELKFVGGVAAAIRDTTWPAIQLTGQWATGALDRIHDNAEISVNRLNVAGQWLNGKLDELKNAAAPYFTGFDVAGSWGATVLGDLFSQLQGNFKEPVMVAGSWGPTILSDLWDAVQNWFSARPVTVEVKTSYTASTTPQGVAPGTQFPVDVTAPYPEYQGDPRYFSNPTSPYGYYYDQYAHNAVGTDFWRGGPTWVGEEGPELLNLPRGAQIFSNPDSRRLVAGFAEGTASIAGVARATTQMAAAAAQPDATKAFVFTAGGEGDASALPADLRRPLGRMRKTSEGTEPATARAGWERGERGERGAQNAAGLLGELPGEALSAPVPIMSLPSDAALSLRQPRVDVFGGAGAAPAPSADLAIAGENAIGDAPRAIAPALHATQLAVTIPAIVDDGQPRPASVLGETRRGSSPLSQSWAIFGLTTTDSRRWEQHNSTRYDFGRYDSRRYDQRSFRGDAASLPAISVAADIFASGASQIADRRALGGQSTRGDIAASLGEHLGDHEMRTIAPMPTTGSVIRDASVLSEHDSERNNVLELARGYEIGARGAIRTSSESAAQGERAETELPQWVWPQLPEWQWPAMSTPDWLVGLTETASLQGAAPLGALLGARDVENWKRYDLRGYAVGTDAYPGGLGVVGERGPELVWLPRGTQIFNNSDTKTLLNATGGVSGLLRADIPGFAEGTTSLDDLLRLLKRGLSAVGLWVPQRPAAQYGPKTREEVFGWQNFQRQGAQAMQGAAKQAGDAFEEAAEQANGAFKSALQSVPGLFGTSQVTTDQLRMADLGLPQNFADDYLRRLSDEVFNGVDWAGVDIQDAAARAGIDPNLPAEMILQLFKQAWNDSSLFANPANLDLINQDAVRAAIEQQQQELAGKANIMQLFGITDENSQEQAEALGAGLASVFGQAAQGDAFKAVGVQAFTAIGAGFSDPGTATIAVGDMAGAVITATGTPESQAALGDAGAAAAAAYYGGWVDFMSTVSPVPPTGTLPTPPTGMGTAGGAIPSTILPVVGPSVGHNATGTTYWHGGWTVVGERGPELVDLPQGAQVYDASTTRRWRAAAAQRDGTLAGRSAGRAAGRPVVVNQTFVVNDKLMAEQAARRAVQLIRRGG